MAKDLMNTEKSFDLHPCDTPHGMLYYDMGVLTDDQQVSLNDLKVQTIREDEQYLASHPEIRACIVLLTRQVLRKRPRNNIHEAIAEFFARSRLDIEFEINDYLVSREPHVTEGNSAVHTPDTTSFSVEDSLTGDDTFVDAAIDQLGKDDDIEAFWGDDFNIDSLHNIGLDFNKIYRVKNLSSDTVINSISVITGMYVDAMITNNYDMIKNIIQEDILSKVVEEKDEVEEFIQEDNFGNNNQDDEVIEYSVIRNITDLALPLQENEGDIASVEIEKFDIQTANVPLTKEDDV